MSASTSTCLTTSIAMSAYTCLQPKSTPLDCAHNWGQPAALNMTIYSSQTNTWHIFSRAFSQSEHLSQQMCNSTTEGVSPLQQSKSTSWQQIVHTCMSAFNNLHVCGYSLHVHMHISNLHALVSTIHSSRQSTPCVENSLDISNAYTWQLTTPSAFAMSAYIFQMYRSTFKVNTLYT